MKRALSLLLLCLPFSAPAADDSRFDRCVANSLVATAQKFGVPFDSLSVSKRYFSPVQDQDGELYDVQILSKLDRVYDARMRLRGEQCEPVSLRENFVAEEDLRRDRETATPRCHCAHTYQDLDGGIGFSLIRCVTSPDTGGKSCETLKKWSDRNFSTRPLNACRAFAVQDKASCPIFDAEVEENYCIAGLSNCRRGR